MTARFLRKLLIAFLSIGALVGIAPDPLSTSQPNPLDSVIRHVNVQRKIVALTFDDGPDPRFTPRLVRMLDGCGVRATFFMIGDRMKLHPQIVKQVMASGNEIANHTWSHPSSMRDMPPTQVRSEIHSCEDAITDLTGQPQRYFRPPKGYIDSSLLTVADVEGYKTVLWTVCANHKDAQTPEAMADRVISRVKPGAIILAHDGRLASRWKDVAATRIIIRRLQAKGYVFVTVSDLLTQSGQP